MPLNENINTSDFTEAQLNYAEGFLGMVRSHDQMIINPMKGMFHQVTIPLGTEKITNYRSLYETRMQEIAAENPNRFQPHTHFAKPVDIKRRLYKNDWAMPEFVIGSQPFDLGRDRAKAQIAAMERNEAQICIDAINGIAKNEFVHTVAANYGTEGVASTSPQYLTSDKIVQAMGVLGDKNIPGPYVIIGPFFSVVAALNFDEKAINSDYNSQAGMFNASGKLNQTWKGISNIVGITEMPEGGIGTSVVNIGGTNHTIGNCYMVSRDLLMTATWGGLDRRIIMKKLEFDFLGVACRVFQQASAVPFIKRNAVFMPVKVRT